MRFWMRKSVEGDIQEVWGVGPGATGEGSPPGSMSLVLDLAPVRTPEAVQKAGWRQGTLPRGLAHQFGLAP